MSIFTKIYNTILKIFGDIKIYKFPFFVLYDPGSYLIKGDECREIMNILKPGDIIVRGYKNYLDGYFIPGFFSHAGLYLGNVPNSEKITLLPYIEEQFYAKGEQIVAHAMAEGVFMEDVLNFCRCDYLLILRIKEISSQEIDEIYITALNKLGTPYDYQFDFSTFHNLSCTEFVYVCMRDKLEQEGVYMRQRRKPIFLSPTLIPDDFIDSSLEIVWKSKEIPSSIIEKIKINK